MTKSRTFPLAVGSVAVGMLLNPVAAQADVVGDFPTPSGNIYCQMSSGTVGGAAAVACEGGGSQAGPAPACAEHMQWGDRFYLTQGQAVRSDCHTDTIRSNQAQAPVLEYGQTSTGHAFTMSREANTLS